MANEPILWVNTCNRFIVFMDIMGFRERVFRNSHATVLSLMESFKKGALKPIEVSAKLAVEGAPENVWTLFGTSMIWPIMFSDSILLVSNDDTSEAADHIFFTIKWLMKRALKEEIPLKGAIARGELTVDVNNSIYFGRPLIDAFDLQHELYIYGVILHHSAEQHLKQLQILHKHELDGNLFKYQTPLKSGSICHYVVNWMDDLIEQNTPEEALSQLYNTVSGTPRKYVDNTLDFAKALVADNKTRKTGDLPSTRE